MTKGKNYTPDVPIEKTTQEIKLCWKCKTPLLINEYGFSVCHRKLNHFDNEDAIVFGDREGTYKVATEPDPTFVKQKLENLSYQQKGLS